MVVTDVNFALFCRLLGTEVGKLSSDVKIALVCGSVHKCITGTLLVLF